MHSHLRDAHRLGCSLAGLFGRVRVGWAPGPPLNFKVGLLGADGGPRRFLFPYFLKAEAVVGLAADDPAALAQFYGALLGVAPQPRQQGRRSRPWRPGHGRSPAAGRRTWQHRGSPIHDGGKGASGAAGSDGAAPPADDNRLSGPQRAERRKSNQLEKEIRTLRQQLNRFSEINPDEWNLRPPAATAPPVPALA